MKVVVPGFSLAFLLFAVVAFAQPDPRQMSGVPLPSGDLPDRSVSVRVVRGSMANNVQGHDVELVGAGDPRRLQTDGNGRAIFNDLPAGAAVQAITTLDGERLQSQSFAVPARGGVRLVLVGSGPGSKAGAAGPSDVGPGFSPGPLTFGGQSRIVIELGDDSLEVFYLFDIVNPGQAPVTSGPITLEMPTGASGASVLEGSTPQATAKGPRVVVTAPFQPGTTPVQIAYRLPYSGSTLTLAQRLPVALDQLALIAEKSGAVDLESAQISDRREMPIDGRTYIAARGAGVAAGEVLTLALTGLPHHSRVPRTAAIAIALAILGVGGWAAARRPDTAAARPPTGSGRTTLERRRERLFDQLVAIEDRQRRRAISAGEYSRRRDDLIRELEQVYQALEATRAA